MEKTIITKLPAGRIEKIVKLKDGTYEVIQKVTQLKKEVALERKNFDNDFILIEAEKLSLSDEFMQYNPKNEKERAVKELICDVINQKVRNFYRPKCDPSFTDDDKGISFISASKPAVCKTYSWWFDIASSYNEKRNSRLGTKLEYGAFLGILIKKLIGEGKSVEWAWNAVCNDSCELGHYWTSENAKHGLEPTGSREICGFYDLANVYKILQDKGSESFCLAGGAYDSDSACNPLSNIDYYNLTTIGIIGVGWIVLS